MRNAIFRTRAVPAALALLLPTLALAAPPRTVMVEGTLRSIGGGPVADGKYDLTFSIYGAKSGGTATFTEGPVSVTTSGGRFAFALGSTVALEPTKLAGLPSQWLSIKVGGDPELTRQPMHASAFALVAGDLACEGCVHVSNMKFDANINLGGSALTAAKLTVSGEALVQGTVSANKFVGDGSQLTGIQFPAGKCGVGDVVTGIDQNGKLICAKDQTGGASAFSNQFTDSLHGNKGLPIPDFNSSGLLDTINVPDVGVAKSFEVTIELSKAPFVDVKPADGLPDYDPTDLTVFLFPPTTKALPNPRSNVINDFLSKPTINGTMWPHYLLHQGAGAGKLALYKTFPTKDKPLSGDLGTWVGKNPKGKWRLLVVDNKDRANPNGTDTKVDGKLVDWSIHVTTINDKQILFKGSQFIDGTLWGQYQGHGASSLGGPVKVGGGIQVGSNTAACNAATKGVIRYNDTINNIEFCNGKQWSVSSALQSPKDGAIYRWAVWETYWSWGTGWYSNNRAELYGGVNPSSWSSNGRAYQISSSSEVLRGFFHRRGPAIAGHPGNSMVMSIDWAHPWGQSAMGRFVAALFRVRNTTGSNKTWTVRFYATAYGGWSDRASLAVNGSNVWDSGGSNYNGSAHFNVNATIPANRTSTVIVVSASSPQGSGNLRTLNLVFDGNCLHLPSGLEFIDDLDTKPNGWNH